MSQVKSVDNINFDSINFYKIAMFKWFQAQWYYLKSFDAFTLYRIDNNQYCKQ